MKRGATNIIISLSSGLAQRDTLDFLTYAIVSLVTLPDSMRFSDSSTSILFVYMYFLASCMGARASSGVASYVSIALF